MDQILFEPWMIVAILPEILVVLLAVFVLFLDLALKEKFRRNLGWVVAVGLGLALVLGLILSRPGNESQLMWGGMLMQDWLGFTFRMLFLFAAAITALFSMDLPRLGNRGEYYLLMLASTLGMMLMAGFGGPDYALPGNRNNLDPVIYIGWLFDP